MLVSVHVLLSLVGLGSGLVLISSFLRKRKSAEVNVLFLATTAATNITGLLFPFHSVTPGIVVALISLPILAFGALALMKKGTPVFMIASVFAQCLNFLVLIGQAFAKLPGLRTIAMEHSSAVGVTQLLTLLAHIVLGVLIIRRFGYGLS